VFVCVLSLPYRIASHPPRAAGRGGRAPARGAAAPPPPPPPPRPEEAKKAARETHQVLKRAKVHGERACFKEARGQDAVALRSCVVDESQRTWLKRSQDVTCTQMKRVKEARKGVPMNDEGRGLANATRTLCANATTTMNVDIENCLVGPAVLCVLLACPRGLTAT
jgi:hypothetical protein